MLDRVARDDIGSAEAALLPLCVRGLRLTVAGRHLIDGIDLDLAGGGITMVMGPNGAGKSLLLRLLHGMMRPTGGTILWGGRPLDDRVRRRQAMVFQKPVMLRRSVAANVAFVLHLRGKPHPTRVGDILTSVGLTDRASQPARLLSGGEQQRLALARALATDPEVLFLDEPTASLDPASTAEIEAIVADIARAGSKVVFVSHDIGQARRLAADVVFMKSGRIAEHTPASRFFTEPRSAAAADFIAGRLVL